MYSQYYYGLSNLDTSFLFSIAVICKLQQNIIFYTECLINRFMLPASILNFWIGKRGLWNYIRFQFCNWLVSNVGNQSTVYHPGTWGYCEFFLQKDYCARAASLSFRELPSAWTCPLQIYRVVSFDILLVPLSRRATEKAREQRYRSSSILNWTNPLRYPLNDSGSLRVHRSFLFLSFQVVEFIEKVTVKTCGMTLALDSIPPANVIPNHGSPVK